MPDDIPGPDSRQLPPPLPLSRRRAPPSAQTVADFHVLAQRLRARRKELGLTLEEAADAVGVSLQQWAKYEGAVNRVPWDVLTRCVDALGMTPAELLLQGEQQLSGDEVRLALATRGLRGHEMGLVVGVIQLLVGIRESGGRPPPWLPALPPLAAPRVGEAAEAGMRRESERGPGAPNSAGEPIRRTRPVGRPADDAPEAPTVLRKVLARSR